MKLVTDIIYDGDCVAILKNFPRQSIDCVVTSPPYDNLRTYSNMLFYWKLVIDSIIPVLKDGGVIVWVVGDATIKGSETGTSFRQALYFLGCGLLLHDTMIYERQAVYPAKKTGNRYTQNFEYMFVFSKGKPKTANLICDKPNSLAGQPRAWGKSWGYDKDGKKVYQINDQVVADFSPRNNIWRYVAGSNVIGKCASKLKHSAAFPYLLAYDHVCTWTNEGDIVLDPMCGSGTTCQAAFNLKRHYIGIEIDSRFVPVARKRAITKVKL
jgi:site-specific DNA-methyltransferase (adenine-specific)